MIPEQLGPYRLLRRLGRGGMGTVYAGVNVETDQPAAVKVLAGELGHEPDFRNRFAVEIETLRRLDHPNIVRLFGFGEHDGQLFYAMELVDGVSLEEELRAGRRFTWREVIRIGSQTCQALRHAHDRGIIHRDIKPANLLWTADGVLKLSDFGIARLFGNTRLTAVGNVIGTVEYMAPEQADARPVDPRTDLYCLGGVLYALLAGRPPFKAATLPEMLEKQRREQPRPLAELVADVPEELSLLIAQLLEKDPKRRVSNAMLLGRRLDVIEIGLARRAAQATSIDVTEGSVEQADRTDASGSSALAGQDSAAPDERPSAPDSVSRQSPDQPRDDLTGMAPTRAMEESEDLPSGVPPTRELSPEDESPATLDTGEFELASLELSGLADAEASSAKTSQSRPEATAVRGELPSRFTPVAEDELDRVPEETPPAVFSLQTGVLVAALVAIGLVIWYFLQPPDADKLYDHIIRQTADGSTASILRAEKDIHTFVTLYSEDPRVGSLRKFEEEIELERLQRQFDRRVKGLTGADSGFPIEQAYLEALNHAWLDPAVGAKKLRALIALYAVESGDTGPTGQCLELARRRLEKLEKQIDQTATDHLALIQKRLGHAEQLRRSDPKKAAEMAWAVIELYADKPWATDALRRAEQLLDASSPAAEPQGDTP